jgi:hypothetical protein
MPRPRLQVRVDQSIEIALCPVAQALTRMAEADAGRRLVMDGTRLAGPITRSGVARHVQVQAALSGAINASGDR